MTSNLFPKVSRSYIESFQFSSWYPRFTKVSPTAVVIRPLSAEFRSYLEEDGVQVPEGSDNIPVESTLSDSESSSESAENDSYPSKTYSFPLLDRQIREAIAEYGAVFPKLNWTSPRDASWLLPNLKCESPADIYLLMKSSDFVSHDLDPSLVFQGCDLEDMGPYDLELVLKKWYAMDPSREFRCFVRDGTLLAIVQRDSNYYPHLNEDQTKDKILKSVVSFWSNNIRTHVFHKENSYVFDIHLTRDLSSSYILDFNPFHPKTDSLLLTYEELYDIYNKLSCKLPASGAEGNPLPIFRTVPSASHPLAIRNAPANQHNAIPFDALHLSSGTDLVTFAQELDRNIRAAQASESEDEAR